MSYYENRIKELEHRIEQMARANRLKAIPVEAQLFDRIAELNKENARLRFEFERLRKAGDELRDSLPFIVDERLDDKTMRKIINRWNAAKDGKPSA